MTGQGNDSDVVIIGAGAAGAAAAAVLGLHVRVIIIDRAQQPVWRVGESLPGAAARLLRAIGAWSTFSAAQHPAAPVRVSRWGSDAAESLDSFRDPDGAGWRLDRARFEADLRANAIARGADTRLGQPVASLARDGGRWQVELADGTRISATLLLDATGRASRLMRPWGQRSIATDRLACVYRLIESTFAAPDSTIYTEAVADGWWYSAVIGTGHRLIAFHSDADLAAPAAVLRQGLLADAARTAGLAEHITGAVPVGPVRMCRASSIARSAAGPGWLAAGDAAIAFDPLSSQGLFNALATGVEAGSAILAALDGGDRAPIWAAYAERIGEVWRAYQRHLLLAYSQERRWRTEPFWARRVRD